MFQFRRFPTYDYLIHHTLIRYCRTGFPHSEISGSKLMCSSPKLIAAYHVLHRLLMPRHSPCALLCLTLKIAAGDFLVQTSRSVQFLGSLKFELCRLIIGSVYPVQQNCNLPKLLVFWKELLFEFLTVAFSSYINLLIYNHNCFFCVQFSRYNWWAKMDSNHRPHDYQSCALASWAIGPCGGD